MELRRRKLDEVLADFDARGVGLRSCDNLTRDELYDEATGGRGPMRFVDTNVLLYAVSPLPEDARGSVFELRRAHFAALPHALQLPPDVLGDLVNLACHPGFASKLQFKRRRQRQQ